MKLQELLKYMKAFFQYFFAVLLVVTYVFLMVWSYCYTLFVCYVLTAAFIASIVIYFSHRSKRQSVNFLLLGLFLFFILSPFNLKQYNRRAESLQYRIEHKGELNTREKLGIYGCLIMITVIDIIPFPEFGIQNFYLLFPTSKKERIFHDSSFLESPSIMKAVKEKSTDQIAWRRWDLVYNKDFRYSIAFDPCKINVFDKSGYKEVHLTTDFGYRERVVTIHASHVLGGIFTFRVDEGLFWYLQQEGWLHPYRAIWIAKLKS